MHLVAVASAAALALASPSALAGEAAANSEVSGDPPPSEPAGDGAATGPAALGPAPAAAAAPTGAPGTAPPPSPGEPPTRPRGPSQWGVLADAGLPQGVTLSAAYRPVPSLRIFAGPAWSLAFGLQGGVSFAPWHFAVTPVLTAEAGRYFGANASFLARGGVPPELSTLMKDMTYTYGAIHAGIEFGSQNGFSFALDLGLGYVALETKGSVTKTDSSGSTVTFTDPRFRGTLPSLKLGLHYWF
jgi:hypothetical protein